MKSMKSAANFKLRGKLRMMCQCGCCEVYNPTWTERLKEAKKEVDNYCNTLYNKQEGKGNEGELS